LRNKSSAKTLTEKGDADTENPESCHFGVGKSRKYAGINPDSYLYKFPSEGSLLDLDRVEECEVTSSVAMLKKIRWGGAELRGSKPATLLWAGE